MDQDDCNFCQAGTPYATCNNSIGLVQCIPDKICPVSHRRIVAYTG